jgi:hypothetical protein
MSSDPASLFWKSRDKFDKYVSKLYSQSTGAAKDDDEEDEEAESSDSDSERKRRKEKKEKKKAKKEKLSKKPAKDEAKSISAPPKTQQQPVAVADFISFESVP